MAQVKRTRATYMDYGSNYMTDEVRNFLNEFRDNIHNGEAQLIWKSYNQFEDITEQSFKVSPWPHESSVMQELQLTISSKGDEIFLLLYRELYYRHIFDRCEITFETMTESFQNYVNLFNMLLEYESNNDNNNNNVKNLPEIPNSWLWDMINSFVSQFQYFQNWKTAPKNLEYLLTFKNTPKQQSIQEKWSIQAVLRYSHALVDCAKIPLKYNAPITEEEYENDTTSTTMKMLGFFSLIALLRVHTITGDYHTAIQVLDPLDLRRKSAITRIRSCHITAQYYLAFCYMMTRRYIDSHNILTNLLSRYQREQRAGNVNVQQQQQRRASNNIQTILALQLEGKDEIYEQLIKKTSEKDISEKDYYLIKYIAIDSLLYRAEALLCIVHSINAIKIDDLLFAPIHDFYNQQMEDINDENIEIRREAYLKLFECGAPDIINTNVYDLFADSQPSLHFSKKQVLHYQFETFLRSFFKKNEFLNKIKEELKLYRGIPIDKLSNMLDFDEKIFQRELLQLKARMKTMKKITNENHNASNEWFQDNEFDFYIKDNIIYIRESEQSKLWRYSNFFIRNVRQMKEIIEANSVSGQ